MNKPLTESMKGAAACMKALQSATKIERLGFDDPETNDNTVERYFRDRDQIKDEFIKNLRGNSSFQSGFISTLAEYVHVSMASGEPDVFDWKPESLMTESEVKENRDEAVCQSARKFDHPSASNFDQGKGVHFMTISCAV